MRASRHGPAVSVAVALAASAVIFALPAIAFAQATCPRTSVADLEDEVMCPVCGTALGLAQEAPQAERQRAFILERVERCQSKAEIKDALVAEFGGEVLAAPADEGFDLAAYLIPAAALALGLGVCALAVARWRRGRTALADGPTDTAAEEPGPPERSDPATRARLERDLERYEL